MSVVNRHSIRQVYKIIATDLFDKDLSKDLAISKETLDKVNLALKRSGISKLKDLQKVIRYLQLDYPYKDVTYSINLTWMFLEFSFIEIRNKDFLPPIHRGLEIIKDD